MLIVLTVSIFFIALVWILFPLGLWLFSHRRFNVVSKKPNRYSQNTAEYNPNITVIIAALNEAKNLKQRVENVYESTYSSAHIEVLIVSDGSDDNTVEVVAELKKAYPNVVLLDKKQREGRAQAHNSGVALSSGEIIFFTDAETEYEADFIEEVVGWFSNPEIGFASGALCYKNQTASGLQASVGLYWKLEQNLRMWETHLGLNVFGTGACCAMRANLYREIPATGDVDFTSPIDVVLQGYSCVHLPNAVATDSLPDSKGREFKARIRMTSKNFHGMLTRWGWNAVFRKPLYTLVILLHKYGRWLTPYAMILVFIATVALLATSPNAMLAAFFVAQLLFYFAGIAGFFYPVGGLLSSINSFVIANAGFFVGVWYAISGRVRSVYVPVSQSQ